jgi:hypothetical protein
VRGYSRALIRFVAIRFMLACLALGTGHAATAQTAEIVACAKDPASDACLAIPGGTQAPPPQWSAGVSAGVAPRDGGPTGVYEALWLHRQLGRSYVQIGAVHDNTTAELGSDATGRATVISNYGVGTVGFGGNYGGWVVDTYASYGRQTFGAVRDEGDVRASTGITSSPYWGGGVSFGRMVAAGSRLFLTPTASIAYAWSRLLRPVPVGSGASDLSISEPTWTGAGRLRLDWLPGHDRKTFVGVTLGALWSNNATSQIGGVGGWGGGAGTLTTSHVHDVWAEVGAHAALSVSRSLQVEATASRTLGLVAGNATTVGLGLRRSF